MKKKFKIVLGVLLLVALVALTVMFFTSKNIAVLNPKGMIALKQRNLLINASLLMLIVVIPVFILAFLFAWKYREGNQKAKYTPEWSHSYLAEFVWWGVPLVIIIILAVMTWTSSHALNPFKPIEIAKKPVKIQVVALEWKWLFIYPEECIASINFLQIPEKTPIEFEITSDAPMNSFWIPELGGQIYAMPAMRTKLYLIADEKGDFRGSSAHLSGVGFAGMHFMAKASSREDFELWVRSVKRDSPRLSSEEYRLLAKPSENNAVSYYVLAQDDLFDQIVTKYHTPSR